MATISDSQVDKLLKDVASIKSVLSENKPVLKQLLLPIHFRIISLISGLAIIGVAALYYFLLDRYGTYQAIPGLIRALSLAAVFAVYVMVVVLKRFLWVKSVKKLDSGFTFGKIIKSIYSYQLLHVWIPIKAVMAFLIVYLCLIDAERFIVSVISIGIGIIYNTIGNITRIWQYLASGYWLIVTGFLPMLLPTESALILLALSLGVGVLFFFFTTRGSQGSGEED